MTKLCFFIGKGGVGKTTVSAAYAVHKASRHGKEAVLLLSTDPAHSLSDIFQRQLGDRASAVTLPGRKHLHVLQVDAEKRFRRFLGRHKNEILKILEAGSIFAREDIEPLLETTLPGMAEMSALLAVHDALRSGKYQRVIVDTAPFGHTLRLFEMPENFVRFLEFLELAASRDRVLAEHFGGSGKAVGGELLRDWRRMAEEVQQALTKDVELFLVTTPEKFAIKESLRAKVSLLEHSSQLEFSAVVLNRVVRRAETCKSCLQREGLTRAAEAVLKREFPRRELYVGEDCGGPVLGVTGLRSFGEHVFAGKRLQWKPVPARVEEPSLRAAEWPVLANPLTLVLGKGGVGKTTVSAALGFGTRRRARSAVEICSVDPAPSLDDVFQTDVGDEPRPVLADAKFRASEIDSLAIFQQWAAEMKAWIGRSMTSQHSSIHVDLWFERELFTRLLESVPPGLDEVMAVFRIVELLGNASTRVVIDMAPTGHALELLRTPERMLAWSRLLLKTLAAHRTLAFAQDAGVKIAELGQRVRNLIQVLKSPEQTRVQVVMLAEPLPDRETERLMSDLETLKLNPNSICVNRILFPKEVEGCARCSRARRWQMATLASLKKKYRGIRLYAARNFPTEVAGKKALSAFTNELWELA